MNYSQTVTCIEDKCKCCAHIGDGVLKLHPCFSFSDVYQSWQAMLSELSNCFMHDVCQKTPWDIGVIKVSCCKLSWCISQALTFCAFERFLLLFLCSLGAHLASQFVLSN